MSEWKIENYSRRARDGAAEENDASRTAVE
jgi:hypothetical protein